MHIPLFKPDDVLDSPEAIALFMADAFETGDAAYIAKALGVVARAKSMTEIRAPMRKNLKANPPAV